MFRNLAQRLFSHGRTAVGHFSGISLGDAHPSDASIEDFWTKHNVSQHRRFPSAEQSLEYFHWRNDQYFNYIDLMPVAGFEGKAILDFGCGPGNDLVGFSVYSKPKRLVGVDISLSSIAEAQDRLRLHNSNAEIIHLPDGQLRQFPDDTFDHIHSSGVLHHIEDLDGTMRELRRIMRPDGTFNVMVYNYDSLWMHLYVAYTKRIVEGRFVDLDLRQAFAKTTDSEDCPVANCYRSSEFIEIADHCGFDAKFTGASMSMHEANLAATRFAAIQSPDLPSESRKFLLSLEQDTRGFLKAGSYYAGIGACFSLTKRRFS